jgi:hypothetical protein
MNQEAVEKDGVEAVGVDLSDIRPREKPRYF